MRYHGKIGFTETKEVEECVWKQVITEKTYTGDMLGPGYKTENGEGINENYRLTNRISIIYDPYLSAHLHAIKYLELYGVKWEIKSATFNERRLILTLGGVYNAQQS